MTEEAWIIYWNEYSSDTYLYGSEITYHSRDDVEFVNHLMPPGTVVKQWYSKTNYQAQRLEPALPMIDGESNYRLITDIDCAPGEECQVRLIFYDRYETEVGNITLRDQVADFKCPLKTYSYCMQLLNGGAEEFRFHSIIIQEVVHEREETIKTIS